MRTANSRLNWRVARISLRLQRLTIVLAATLLGCATTTLPIDHVIIFRNGIA